MDRPRAGTAAADAPRRGVSWWLLVPGIAFVALLALAAAVAWLASEAAVARLSAWATAASGGRLTVLAPAGSVFGTLHAKQIAWRDEGLEIVVDDIALAWSPRALIDQRLHVARLAAARIAVVVPPSTAPAVVPATLALPWPVAVDAVRVDRVDWKAAGREGTLGPVGFRYAGNADGHRIDDLDARAAGIQVSGRVSVEAMRPFATAGALAITLAPPYPEGTVDAQFAGSVELLDVALASKLASLPGDASLVLAPFARRPLIRAKGRVDELDLARFDPTLPRTKLAVTVDVAPDGAGLAGEVDAQNALAGALDAGRVPVQRARARFAYADPRLTLSALEATLDGGATLSGGGEVRVPGGESRWQASVRGLDLRRLHRQLVTTALSGRVDADLTGTAQRVVVDVRQSAMRLAATATYQADRLTVASFTAQADGGTLTGKGDIAFTGARPFTVDAQATRFDPARFGAFPEGALSGTIAARGTLAPAWSADADVRIAPGSRLRGLALAGEARGRIEAAGLHGLDARMKLGSNEVHVQGSYGRSGDRLAVVVDARRLEELMPLLPEQVPRPVSGALAGTVTLDQTGAGGAVAATLRGTHLGVGESWRAGSATLTGRAELDRPLREATVPSLGAVVLNFAGRDLVAPTGSVREARLDLEGTLARHTLTVAVDNGRAAVTGRADGALQLAAEGGPRWQGTIEALKAREPWDQETIALAAPTALEAGPGLLRLGPLRLAGLGATVDADGFEWRAGALTSRGRIRGVPLAALLKRAGIDLRWPTDVTLGGEWAIASMPAWTGQLRIAREGGDLYVDDPAADGRSRIALGLETFAVDARLADGVVRGNAEVRAQRGGTALADFEIASPPGATSPFAAAAPLRAALRAHLPALATLQPWVGTAARIDGQAIADVTVTGTLGQPALAGQLVGYALRADMPQYGLHLRDGALRATSDADGIRIEELSVAAGDGRLTAAGLIALPREDGRLRASRIEWRAQDFRVFNRPDLRLVVDGEGTLALENRRLVLRGQITTDQGTIEYRSARDTALASDIVVVGRPVAPPVDGGGPLDVPLHLDIALDLGRELRFSGEGLEAGLAGRVQVKTAANGALEGRGIIRTVRGTYWAFGQKLDIDRGRVIFDGPLANPALDIVALRRHLPVEAGVEITGTVRAPIVRLTSNPPVPDSEKLSWLLTGAPSGSGTGQREAAALGAATAALVGRDGKPITQRFAQSIGLDEISISQRSGASAADPLSGQVVTVGKRITDRLYVAFEQGLAVATNALRIEYVLSRYFTVAAYAGTSSGVAISFRRSWR